MSDPTDRIAEAIAGVLDDLLDQHRPLRADSVCACGAMNNMDGDVLHRHRVGVMSDAATSAVIDALDIPDRVFTDNLGQRWEWCGGQPGTWAWRRTANALELTEETRTQENFPDGLDIDIRTESGWGSAECNTCSASEHGRYAHILKWAYLHAKDIHGWAGPVSESRLVSPWTRTEGGP